MVDALIRLMNSSDEVTGPVNLGNPEECAMLELAQNISFIMRTEVSFKFEQLPEDDPRQRKPDITLAKIILNWEPHVKLHDGLKKTIDYLRVRHEMQEFKEQDEFHDFLLGTGECKLSMRQ